MPKGSPDAGPDALALGRSVAEDRIYKALSELKAWYGDWNRSAAMPPEIRGAWLRLDDAIAMSAPAPGAGLPAELVALSEDAATEGVWAAPSYDPWESLVAFWLRGPDGQLAIAAVNYVRGEITRRNQHKGGERG